MVLLSRDLHFSLRISLYTAIDLVVLKKLYRNQLYDQRWNYQKHTHVVEMIQRKAGRFCMSNYRRKSSVTEHIKPLGWDSLQLRLQQPRLSLMYKLSNNLIDINLENLLSLIMNYLHVAVMFLNKRSQWP